MKSALIKKSGIFQRIPAWPSEGLPHRLMLCIQMLACHSILPERERDKAIDRVRKKFKV